MHAFSQHALSTSYSRCIECTIRVGVSEIRVFGQNLAYIFSALSNVAREIRLATETSIRLNVSSVDFAVTLKLATV